MKVDELRKRPKEELERMLRDSRERLRALRFDLTSGKVKNVREVRRIKKEIARILTLLKEAITNLKNSADDKKDKKK